MKPANAPVGRIPIDLFHGDHVPDAGAPMGQQGEDEHQQGEDDIAVLRVSVHLLQKSRQSKQSYQLEEVQIKARLRRRSLVLVVG